MNSLTFRSSLVYSCCFSGVGVALYLVFIVVFCQVNHCLSFVVSIKLQLLITPVVSSNCCTTQYLLVQHKAYYTIPTCTTQSLLVQHNTYLYNTKPTTQYLLIQHKAYLYNTIPTCTTQYLLVQHKAYYTIPTCTTQSLLHNRYVQHTTYNVTPYL